jgi:hypothetical protein
VININSKTIIMSKAKTSKKSLTAKEEEEMIKKLKSRFEKNTKLHKGIEWSKVETRLKAKPDKLAVLAEMEATGGEPDVVGIDKKSGEIIFYDCAAESPKDRRSLCYDRQALDERKEFKPKDSAVDMAASIGVELLTEEEYRQLQQLGKFDLKTSSWLLTPAPIRKLGGSIFGDRRYDTVFVYHNGAQSYYAARGFRGKLRV